MNDNNNFEKFWHDNLEVYKDKAKKDYDKLLNGKFEAKITINTDDDFSLNVEPQLFLYANSMPELKEKIIQKLHEIKVLCGRSEDWDYVKEGALEELNSPYNFQYIDFGGNHTIKIDMYSIEPHKKFKM